MSRTNPLRSRGPSLHLALSIAATLVLAGCTSVLSELPHQVGGLPEGAPARSAEPPAYPQVHDMPPKRSEAVLTAEERKKLQADLAAARDGAERRAAEADPKTDSGKPKPKATAKADAKPKPETKADGKAEANADAQAR